MDVHLQLTHEVKPIRDNGRSNAILANTKMLTSFIKIELSCGTIVAKSHSQLIF